MNYNVVDRKLIWGFVIFLAALLTGISFLTLEVGPGSRIDTVQLDKSELIYGWSERHVNSKDYDKAVNGLILVVKQYPNSRYAEMSLRKLAFIFQEKGDLDKACYHYERILKDFPEVTDAGDIRSAINDLGMERMQSSLTTEDSIEYVVQPGDTLSGIDRKFKTTVALIQKMNNILLSF